ncbi:MAG TPA: TraR/DksA family transcriptional regulator [Elusimicrobiales bacterium]|nr:TraR/DksA family transcriptional regulator [Elusimicrobiales bacterium]
MKKKKTTIKKPAKKISAARKPAMARKAVPKKKAPAPKKPVRKSTKVSTHIPAISAKELQEIKQRLNQMKQDIIQRIQEKKNLDMPEAEVGDPIDQASQSLDKEIFFEVSDNDHKLLDQIEATLRRMEKGLYGCCQSCGKTIPLKRLRTLPFARYCVFCQSSNEVSLPEI